jgi:hypothetical protein
MHPIILPTDLFGYMFKHFPAKFVKHVGGTHQKLYNFWSQHPPTDPKLHASSITRMTSWMWLLIPLILFGDAAPYTNSSKESILVSAQTYTSLGFDGEQIVASVL